MSSMEFKNRLGQDNFVWWIGVVEDAKISSDPLKLGRCKVRIFGSHTDNLNLIPTADLPWATPLRSPNNSMMFSSLREGQYVFGFYNDGKAGQVPIILGVYPGIPQSDPLPLTNLGFNKSASFFNNPSQSKLYESKKPRVEPKASAMKIDRVGAPDTPANAYTANNTMLSVTNSDLIHSCDFRFLINFGDFNIGTIENPITLIKQAIANSKNAAQAIIKALLAQLLTGFRIGLKGIIVALNLDPTGNMSKIFSQVKEAIRTINYYSKLVAEYIGNAALVVSLLQQLTQIIEWIKTLPQQVLAMLKDCLSTFQNAVKAASSQIKAIPGQASSSLLGAFQSLEKSASGFISDAQAAANTANIPNTMITLITSPDTANVNVLSQYITTQYPNSNVIIANSESASFNVANTSTP